MKNKLTKQQEMDRWVPKNIEGMFKMNPKLTEKEQKRNDEIDRELKKKNKKKGL